MGNSIHAESKSSPDSQRSLPLQDFECSVCKEKLSLRIESFANGKIVAAHKAAIFKEWDAHLNRAHRRQWDSEQAKKAKREAKRQQS